MNILKCMRAIAIATATFACGCMPNFEPEKTPPVKETLSAADLKTEIARGETVVEWLKKDEELTELQKKDAFTQFKGKYIIVHGTVEEVGEVTLSFDDDIYVALNVGKIDRLNEIHIQFNALKGVRDSVKALHKGDAVAMRGRMTGMNGIETMFVKLVCDDAEVVTVSKYKEAQECHTK